VREVRLGAGASAGPCRLQKMLRVRHLVLRPREEWPKRWQGTALALLSPAALCVVP